MADAVVTKTARTKMLKARSGDIALPKIIGMAFGSGGVSSGGTVIEPSVDQVSLNNELLRKSVSGHEYLSDTVCRYTCTLEPSELAGKNISELGLYDADGDLIAIKTFTAKGKDDDLEMTFQIDDSM